MRISVELVPRSQTAIVRDAHFIRERFGWVTMLNIPDLLRLPLRSWDACSATASIYRSSVPHVRDQQSRPSAFVSTDDGVEPGVCT